MLYLVAKCGALSRGDYGIFGNFAGAVLGLRQSRGGSRKPKGAQSGHKGAQGDQKGTMRAAKGAKGTGQGDHVFPKSRKWFSQ